MYLLLDRPIWQTSFWLVVSNVHFSSHLKMVIAIDELMTSMFADRLERQPYWFHN